MDSIYLCSILPPPQNVSASAGRHLSMNKSSAQVDHCSADPLSYYFVAKVKLP